jgi:predicted acyltransferase
VRLRSIDVFRGLTVAGMVIVNNPGDWSTVYAPLLHAEWHGWTPTDLVFPFFLFIVGVAVTLARRVGSSWAVVRRGLTIFALGLFLSGFPYFNIATWRIPGVLQRIALCYVAAAFILRAIDGRDDRQRAQRLLAIVAAIVVGYAVAMCVVPFPGGWPGDLTAEGNLGARIDRALLAGHLWRPGWDPEGLFSTIPAIGTTLLGVVAGLELRAAESRQRWVRHLLLGGVGAAALGLIWNPWFPINKSLWTSSYVLFTAGVAAMTLALCSLWVDTDDAPWRRRTSEPFVALGRNALLLFVLSGLIGRLLGVLRVGDVSLKTWIYTQWFAPLASPKNASLLFALVNLLVLWALLWWLHRRKTYWSV